MRFKIAIPLVIFLFVFAGYSYAEPQNPVTIEKVGKLKLEATVPQGFSNSLLINFTAGDGNSVIKRLDAANAYKTSEEVPIGKYTIGFINIVGKNATDYSIQYPETLAIEEGKEAAFSLKIELKQAAKNNPVKETAPVTEQEPTSEKDFEKMLEQMDSSHATVSENRQNQSVPVPAKQPELKTNMQVNSGRNPINDAAASILFFAVCGIVVLLFFAFRHVAYKHDYYDI